MKTITICIPALLLCTTALARIGETEAQIETRYGKPTKTLTASEMAVPGISRAYKSAGIIIIVTFADDISGSESYSKGSQAKLESSEVEAILAANAGGKKWTEIKIGDPFYDWRSRRWLLGQLPDALFADFNQLDGRLSICSMKFLDSMSAASKEAAKAKLKSF